MLSLQDRDDRAQVRLVFTVWCLVAMQQKEERQRDKLAQELRQREDHLRLRSMLSLQDRDVRAQVRLVFTLWCLVTMQQKEERQRDKVAQELRQREDYLRLRSMLSLLDRDDRAQVRLVFTLWCLVTMQQKEER